jgi:hypothetical protein
VARAGCIGHGVLLEPVLRRHVRALIQQLLRHRCLAIERRAHERRDSIEGGEVHIRTRGEHPLREVHLVVLEQDDEGALAQPVARIDGGARRQGALEAGRVGIAGSNQEPGVDGQVRVVRRLGRGAGGEEATRQRDEDATEQHGIPVHGGRNDAPHNRCFIAATDEKYYKRQRAEAARSHGRSHRRR